VVLAVTQQSVYAWEAAKAVPSEDKWVQLELALGPLGVVRPEAVQAQDAATEGQDAAGGPRRAA
jgi:hypothetical protein